MTMKADAARETAVRILYEVHENCAYANVALAQALRRSNLSDQDRRFVTELVYGSVKAGGTIDWIIRRYTTRPVRRLQPMIRAILRLGAYQLFYLDRVPASAVCNTSVEIAKKMGVRSLSGFVNGVLRTMARDPKKAAFPKGKGHAIEGLALASQHPEWLVRRWVRTFGFAEAEALCSFDNTEPPLSLRTNTLRGDREQLLASLKAEGAEPEASHWTPEGIRLLRHGSLDALTPLQDGRAQVQDESSMLVAHVVRPRPGATVIDCCAAPGGKTTHLAALMGDAGRIIAGDIYEHKLARIRENAERLGIRSIETQLLDAREAGGKYPGVADCVLVDAPCSGLGVLRRKPDARWRKTAAELAGLPALQLAILKSAGRAVKAGGTLVYSTCTIELAENQEVVSTFLQSDPAFSLEVTGAYLPDGNGNARHRTEKMVQLMPHVDGTDGFFIARMKKE